MIVQIKFSNFSPKGYGLTINDETVLDGIVSFIDEKGKSINIKKVVINNDNSISLTLYKPIDDDVNKVTLSFTASESNTYLPPISVSFKPLKLPKITVEDKVGDKLSNSNRTENQLQTTGWMNYSLDISNYATDIADFSVEYPTIGYVSPWNTQESGDVKETNTIFSKWKTTSGSYDGSTGLTVSGTSGSSIHNTFSYLTTNSLSKISSFDLDTTASASADGRVTDSTTAQAYSNVATNVVTGISGEDVLKDIDASYSVSESESKDSAGITTYSTVANSSILPDSSSLTYKRLAAYYFNLAKKGKTDAANGNYNKNSSDALIDQQSTSVLSTQTDGIFDSYIMYTMLKSSGDLSAESHQYDFWAEDVLKYDKDTNNIIFSALGTKYETSAYIVEDNMFKNINFSTTFNSKMIYFVPNSTKDSDGTYWTDANLTNIIY